MNIVSKFAAVAAVTTLAVSPVAASAATKHHHVHGKHHGKSTSQSSSEGDGAVSRLNEQSLQQARAGQVSTSAPTTVPATTAAPMDTTTAPAQPQ